MIIKEIYINAIQYRRVQNIKDETIQYLKDLAILEAKKKKCKINWKTLNIKEEEISESIRKCEDRMRITLSVKTYISEDEYINKVNKK